MFLSNASRVCWKCWFLAFTLREFNLEIQEEISEKLVQIDGKEIQEEMWKSSETWRIKSVLYLGIRSY